MKRISKHIWLYFLVLILASSACHHRNTSTTITDSTVTTTSTVVVNHPTRQSIVEDFEQGSKGAYSTGNVGFKSGDWSLIDALTGGSKEDAKTAASLSAFVIMVNYLCCLM